MSDHQAAAQRYRDRAAKCELSAKNTSSIEFGECYRLLAQHYLVLADLEEDCARRRPLPPRQEDNKPADNTLADKTSAPSVASQMFAVRQLQTALLNGLPSA